jgi:hypothetical protein
MVLFPFLLPKDFRMREKRIREGNVPSASFAEIPRNNISAKGVPVFVDGEVGSTGYAYF